MKQKISKNTSVEKALEILECFDHKHSTLTLEDISSITGYPKTTTFRLINSLESYGYLKRNNKYKETKFSLGWTFLNKGNLVSTQLNIREVANDDMIELRNDTGLTVQLAIKDGDQAVYIEQFESLKPIQLYPQIGKRAPLYAAACPRVLLAYLPEKERDHILNSSHFDSYTSNTLTDTKQIKKEILKIRNNGYSISRGELHKGTIAIAAPIFGIDERVSAAMSVVGLQADFDNGYLETCIQSVTRFAESISLKLKEKN